MRELDFLLQSMVYHLSKCSGHIGRRAGLEAAIMYGSNVLFSWAKTQENLGYLAKDRCLNDFKNQ